MSVRERHMGRWGGLGIILLFVAASFFILYSTPPSAHAQCSSDCQCMTGQACDLLSGTCVAGTNNCSIPSYPTGGSSGNLPVGYSCSSNSDCSSGYCGGDGTCWCTSNSQCSLGYYCNTAIGGCSPNGSTPAPSGSGSLSNGSSCTSDSQCSSGYCDPTSQSCQTIGGSVPGYTGSGSGSTNNFYYCFQTNSCAYFTSLTVCNAACSNGCSGPYSDSTCGGLTGGVQTQPSGGGSAGNTLYAPGSAPAGSVSLTLTNPLTSCSDLTCMLSNVINFIFTLSIPILGIMIIVGGFQMLTSAGNPEKFSSGKKTLLYSVIGFVVILLAGSIAGLIKSIFGG